ncbi:3'-5' exonuclease [Rhizobium halophytocola]|uniref:DNA polymerase-3 subunit epsilon n=1 Tax=Rhizobium halophytocola TaxID=735519 RepID=A0ABS4E2Y7_9HYPH|nr:3'-5' exonuclease [Rhizobium halophytocola]MBP1852315.1 DNA polymerase-3 subunit epsilon [Rhizobium halophytocola]
MKAIAIDFETATEARASACSVGIAFIEDGEVVRVEERLIRPPEMRFSPFNIAIHGIRPEHVIDAPEFPDVMAEFESDFAGALMLAHNAAFDFSVLRQSFALYGLETPEVSYLCTVKLAQRHWPDLGSHRLNVLAAHLGLRFQHHNAAEDARICGLAAIAMAREVALPSIEDLAEMHNITPGRLYRGGYDACAFARKPQPARRLQARSATLS